MAKVSISEIPTAPPQSKVYYKDKWGHLYLYSMYEDSYIKLASGRTIRQENTDDMGFEPICTGHVITIEV